MDRRVKLLILSTADWDRPVWTNKQHLAARLADEFDVTFVDSFALRRPRVSVADVRRSATFVWRRLPRLGGRTCARPFESRAAGVHVVSPLLVPWHREAPQLIRRLNAWLLHRAIADWLASDLDVRAVWSFTPVTYDLELESAAFVYNSVDLLHEFPGVDADALRQSEARLAARGVRAIASSEPVSLHLRHVGFQDVRTWQNVGDFDLFKESETDGVIRDCVFAGNLVDSKVDIQILRDLALHLDGHVLHLAGPIGEGGPPSTELEEVLRRPGVLYHGVLSQAELALLFSRCRVGLIPYRQNPYTAGVFPMKVFEYMAAGLEVVSTRLPSLDGAGLPVDLVDDADFAPSVISRLNSKWSVSAQLDRQAVASRFSWSQRSSDARDLLLSMLAPIGD